MLPLALTAFADEPVPGKIVKPAAVST